MSVTLTKTFTATATLGAWVTAIKAAGVGIGKRPVTPTLSGVKIESLAGDVRVIGFDYETYVIADVAYSRGSGAPIVLPYKMLLDILTGAGKRATKRVSDAWDVTIREDGNAVKLDIQGAVYTVSSFPAEEYPEIPSLDAESALTVDPAVFIRRMDSALVAASTDDTLPVLESVRIEIAGGVMSLLSTDRYRLTLAEMPVNSMIDQAFLLKAGMWKLFKKHLSVKGGPLTLRFTEAENGYKRIGFRQGGLELDTAEIDGQFPKIRSLFPDSPEIVFEMDADLLAAHVAAVSVTAARNTPVRLTYNGIDSLRVDAGTGEEAQAQAFMPYSAERGNRGFSVAFNPAYILAALKDLKGQTIHISHTSAPKPALVSAKDSSDVLHLLMPVRLPNS